MAQKVNPSPAIPILSSGADLKSLQQFDTDLVRALMLELIQHAARLNDTLTLDGTEIMTAPLRLASYTVAGVPAAADFAQGLIYVSNEAGGAVLAFSDGTNWRRVTDRAVVS